MKPLVTIGITAFNAADSVGRAVASALAQDWWPIEIVIVDDASTDATWTVIAHLASRHSEIRAYAQPVNSGVGAARSRIVAEAEGEFIAFFDDDDLSMPGRLRRQVERIETYEMQFAPGAPVICHSAREQVALDGTRRIEPTMGDREGVVAPHGAAVARTVLYGAPLADGQGAQATCSQMARTSTYRQLGGFDPAFRRVEDTDFCVRAALAGAHFVGIAEPLVEQTLTRTSDKSLAEELRYKLLLIDKHRPLFNSDAHYRHSRAWMVNKHHWLAGRRVPFLLGLAKAGILHPKLTWMRLRRALPGLESNRAFARFHGADTGR
jgi:glycosyltransferase involved in cell wall biosynthesis